MHCSGVLGHVKNWHFNNSLPKVQKVEEKKKKEKKPTPNLQRELNWLLLSGLGGSINLSCPGFELCMQYELQDLLPPFPLPPQTLLSCGQLSSWEKISEESPESSLNDAQEPGNRWTIEIIM